MRRFAIKLAVVATLVLPYTLAAAQTIGSFLRDTKIPQRIKPADLGDDMRAIKIGIDKQGGDFMSMLMSPFMMLGALFGGVASSEGAKPEDTAATRFLDMMSISWTNGSTVTLYAQEYLVTYTPQIDFSSIVKSKTPPDISKMELGLTLVNVKSITTMTPRPDMTKEEWTKAAPAVDDTASKKTTTLSNLKQLSLGMIMYTTDYDDYTPYVQATRGAFEVTYPYIKNKDITRTLNPNGGGEFRLNMSIAGISTTALEMPADTPMYYEPNVWPDGTRGVAFMDGHAKFVTAEEWAKLQPYLNLKIKRVGKPLPATLGLNWGSG